MYGLGSNKRNAIVWTNDEEFQQQQVNGTTCELVFKGEHTATFEDDLHDTHVFTSDKKAELVEK